MKASATPATPFLPGGQLGNARHCECCLGNVRLEASLRRVRRPFWHTTGVSPKEAPTPATLLRVAVLFRLFAGWLAFGFGHGLWGGLVCVDGLLGLGAGCAWGPGWGNAKGRRARRGRAIRPVSHWQLEGREREPQRRHGLQMTKDSTTFGTACKQTSVTQPPTSSTSGYNTAQFLFVDRPTGTLRDTTK